MYRVHLKYFPYCLGPREIVIINGVVVLLYIWKRDASSSNLVSKLQVVSKNTSCLWKVENKNNNGHNNNNNNNNKDLLARTYPPCWVLKARKQKKT